MICLLEGFAEHRTIRLVPADFRDIAAHLLDQLDNRKATEPVTDHTLQSAVRGRRDEPPRLGAAVSAVVLGEVWCSSTAVQYALRAVNGADRGVEMK